MARVAVEIPKVGLVMENARLVRWLKKVGETVTQGEPLLELEMEKSVVEIEATDNGRLVEILFGADQEVGVGERVGWLEVEARAAPESRVPWAGVVATGARPSSLSASVHATPSEATAADATAPADIAQPAMAGADPAPRVRSSPVARRLAAEHALDLRQVAGTGPRGRVQLADVRRALDAEPPSLSNINTEAPHD